MQYVHLRGSDNIGICQFLAILLCIRDRWVDVNCKERVANKRTTLVSRNDNDLSMIVSLFNFYFNL